MSRHFFKEKGKTLLGTRASALPRPFTLPASANSPSGVTAAGLGGDGTCSGKSPRTQTTPEVLAGSREGQTSRPRAQTQRRKEPREQAPEELWDSREVTFELNFPQTARVVLS